MNIKTVIGHKSAYSVSMLRMILFPILTYVVMKIINVDFEVRATAVILAAMPSGSLNAVSYTHLDVYKRQQQRKL